MTNSKISTVLSEFLLEGVDVNRCTAARALGQIADPQSTGAIIEGNNWSGRAHMTPASNRIWDHTGTIAEFVRFRGAMSVQ